ncbi:MAG: peptidoglycan DD-metalloendopeptidase family protein [Deltaproteobacteria bacterium]|nr:peptidoglycan DD-metalloendopeptidase family protein [Deltaproteobacteria bacterium]
MAGPSRTGVFLLFLLGTSGAWAQLPLGSVTPVPDLGAVEAQLAQARGSLASLRDSAQAMRSEAGSLRERVGELKTRVRRDARALYRMRRAAPISLDGGVAGMLARLSRVSRLERILVRESQDAARLSERSESLGQRAGETEASLRDAQARVDGLSARKASLEARSREQLFAGSGLGRLPVAPVPSMPEYGSLRVVGGGSGLGEFAQMRGRLTLPVAGVARFVDTQVEAGPALRIEASASSGVRAAAQGRVAFVGRQEGMGLVVILEHPGGFFSVYAGLGAVGLRVGDGVGAGASLGHANAGGSFTFQVRRGTRALDPRSWLGL